MTILEVIDAMLDYVDYHHYITINQYYLMAVGDDSVFYYNIYFKNHIIANIYYNKSILLNNII